MKKIAYISRKKIMTGKCKKDFEKWFKLNVEYDFHGDQSSYNITSDFLDLPHSMQWGVIVDFFDSVGITIEIDAGCLRYDTEDADIRYQGGVRGCPFTEVKNTRHEARASAIEKATGIYNERS